MSAIVRALLGELDLTPENDISNAAAAFTDVVKGYVRTIQDNPDMKNAARENDILSSLYQAFFKYSLEWAAQERKKTVRVQNHAEAAKLKQAAAEALEDLQKNILRFALVYAHIDRCSGFVHQEMLKNENVATGESGSKKGTKWTSDVGTVLRRYQKERNELRESHARLGGALKTLEVADENFSALESALERVHGKDAPRLLTSLRSNLRVGEFDKARKSAAAMVQAPKKFTLDKKAGAENIKTIQTKSAALIDLFEKSREDLSGSEGKLFLSTAELRVLLATQEREIEQKVKYIEKYYQPYMEHKLKSLGHLREKLLVFGSLEGLTTLYMRMMRGLAQPMAEIKDVRAYEAEVINNVNFILSGQFQEIGNIEKWTNEAMDEFYEALADFDEDDIATHERKTA
ncbi:MAG: hypothetical protein KDJ35_04330 [Alphaproteobacteria bacterium]|nr:hypothetical protein [Alphaproteobacteria bacterium]